MAKASNLFARYVWLVDTLRSNGPMSFERISELWSQSGLGFGEPLPLRTFHNHRQAIADIFDIDIECEVKGKNSVYYIEGAERLHGDKFRGWLIDSLSVVNHAQDFKNLSSRISMEHVPSGNRWLIPLCDAMRQNAVVRIEYQSYSKQHSNTFEVSPYGLKMYQRRWYLIAYNDWYKKIMVYSLDRMHNVVIAEQHFEIPADFNVDDYFSEYYGISHDDSIPCEDVVIKVYGYACNYIADLPLHNSQSKIGEDENADIYTFHLRPTYDFITQLLQYASQIEVLRPQWLRDEMSRHIGLMYNLYNQPKPCE